MPDRSLWYRLTQVSQKEWLRMRGRFFALGIGVKNLYPIIMRGASLASKEAVGVLEVLFFF
jgi:hypothetical protein